MERLEKYGNYLKNLNGFDRVARFIQYFCRIMRHAFHLGKGKEFSNWFQSRLPFEILSDKFSRTNRAISACRRFNRFGRHINTINGMMKLIGDHIKIRHDIKHNKVNKQDVQYEKTANNLWVTLKITNGILACIFNGLDHIFWAYTVGIYKNRAKVSKILIFNDYMWILQGVIACIYDIIEMNMLRKKLEEKKLSEAEKKVCHDKIQFCCMDITKCQADSCCAIGFLSDEYFSDGMIGCFGMLAAYIGIKM